MQKSTTHIRKRIPAVLGALLAGVALAAALSNVIEAPQGQDDYLHDHLVSMPLRFDDAWAVSHQPLPAQDRLEIERLIAQMDYSQGLADNELDTGEASIRVNRHLTEAHLNGDYRVVNIEDKNLRVDFQISPDGANMALRGILDEKRILQFYQTQSGWVQSADRTLSATRLRPVRDADKFETLFSDKVVGLNYYPASASWRDFWEHFPIDEVQSDLDKAKALNVNAMRIFLTHDYFNDDLTRLDALSKLNRFLDLCQEKDIKVLVTLFDLRPDYTISNWDADIRHIDTVLDTISAHDALLGIDLKNQPDLDFENWGEGRVEAWLTVMARRIQSKYSGVAVTAGWSEAANAFRLNDVFDVVTYHEYDSPKFLQDRLKDVVSKANGKPVMITEIGSTIWHPPFITRTGEAAQASRLQAQLSQASRANGVFIWTLNDFDHVGKEVVGPLPWRQAQQRHFGILRSDGSYRPAAHVFKNFGARAKTDIDITKSSFLTPIPQSTF